MHDISHPSTDFTLFVVPRVAFVLLWRFGLRAFACASVCVVRSPFCWSARACVLLWRFGLRASACVSVCVARSPLVV